DTRGEEVRITGAEVYGRAATRQRARTERRQAALLRLQLRLAEARDRELAGEHLGLAALDRQRLLERLEAGHLDAHDGLAHLDLLVERRLARGHAVDEDVGLRGRRQDAQPADRLEHRLHGHGL